MNTINNQICIFVAVENTERIYELLNVTIGPFSYTTDGLEGFLGSEAVKPYACSTQVDYYIGTLEPTKDSGNAVHGQTTNGEFIYGLGMLMNSKQGPRVNKAKASG